ncbi:MAG: DUF47 domain-containing protein [Bacteroidales bacterium]|jgi:predicted phosphate transport protein (TIGR00153 family)
MNIDKFLKVFVPKETAFFPLFENDAKILIKGTELLAELVKTNDLDERETLIARIKAAESEGDKVTDEIFTQLNKSFITPFDREDIHELASKIDDVLDNINAASQRIRLYKPKTLTTDMKEMADVLGLLAIEIQKAVSQLRHLAKHKNEIVKACDQINMLENKADHVYNLAISKLFDEEKNTGELIKLKDIMASLEKAADKAEDVSDAIRTILIKMA